MKGVENRRIKEIKALHHEIGGRLKSSPDKAIRIGELLSQQKESMERGRFTAWVKANLPFTERTARRYMQLYRSALEEYHEAVRQLERSLDRCIAQSKKKGLLGPLMKHLRRQSEAGDRISGSFRKLIELRLSGKRIKGVGGLSSI